MSSDFGTVEGEDLGDFEAFPLDLGELGSNMASSSGIDSNELNETKVKNKVCMYV